MNFSKLQIEVIFEEIIQYMYIKILSQDSIYYSLKFLIEKFY